MVKESNPVRCPEGQDQAGVSLVCGKTSKGSCVWRGMKGGGEQRSVEKQAESTSHKGLRGHEEGQVVFSAVGSILEHGYGMTFMTERL